MVLASQAHPHNGLAHPTRGRPGSAALQRGGAPGLVALALCAALCGNSHAAQTDAAVAPADRAAAGKGRPAVSAGKEQGESALSCKKAKLQFSSPCQPGTSSTKSCGDGAGGPGMAQLLGTVPEPNVTGLAVAGGFDPALRSRVVSLRYRIRDVRAFAPAAGPDGLPGPVVPRRTSTWIIKSSTVPGPEAHRQTRTHSAANYSTAGSGTSTTRGASDTDATWLLVGQVQASAGATRKTQQSVSYGFVCELPVKNLIPANKP